MNPSTTTSSLTSSSFSSMSSSSSSSISTSSSSSSSSSSGAFPSQELFGSLHQIYVKEEPVFSTLEKDVVRVHDALDRINADLELKTYPPLKDLEKELAKHQKELNTYEEYADKILKLKNHFEDKIEVFNKRLSVKNFITIEFLSKDLCNRTQELYNSHIANKAQLESYLQRIATVYKDSLFHLGKIRAHCLVRFQQRIERVRNGITEPTLLGRVGDKVSRYVPVAAPFLSYAPPPPASDKKE